MYSFMSTANVYPAQKTDKSLRAVQHGFIKTLIHVVVLLLAIIIMSIYYSQLEETKRESIHVDKTKEDWIPYETYVSLRDQHIHDGLLSCDCSRTQIDWSEITESVDTNDDYVCNAMLAGYQFCYFDSVCKDGTVGKLLFWYFNDLCDSAQASYPRGQTPYSLSSGKVYSDSELHSIANELANDWQSQISGPMRTTFAMTYPIMNNRTEFFYDWAVTTPFEDLESESYWNSVWGLQNSSVGIANAFSDVDYVGLAYLTLADAIESAFIDYLSINYRYSNSTVRAASGFSPSGYYQQCAPYQCVWFTANRKTFIEIVVIIFGLLGGIHAALFVVIGIGHTAYRKTFKVKFASEKEENEDNKIQMATHQETAEITAET